MPVAGAVHDSVTVLPEFNTGWLLLNTGALVIGAPATELRWTRPLKHDAAPLPPRHCASVAEPPALNVTAPHDAADASDTAAVGRDGEPAHAIAPSAVAPVSTRSAARTICRLIIGTPSDAVSHRADREGSRRHTYRAAEASQTTPRSFDRSSQHRPVALSSWRRVLQGM